MNFSQSLTPFTKTGRERIHKSLRMDIQRETSLLMNSNIPTRSVEYMDNRISRYSMKLGKCEITGILLYASDVHCHHYIPLNLGGSDKFNNLRILHKVAHKLIHQTHKKTIDTLINQFVITKPMIQKVNQYREKCGMEPI